jgi:hypothetical protein
VWLERIYSPDDNGWYAELISQDGSTVYQTKIYPTEREAYVEASDKCQREGWTETGRLS